jgi:hypothetical protein
LPSDGHVFSLNYSGFSPYVTIFLSVHNFDPDNGGFSKIFEREFSEKEAVY